MRFAILLFLMFCILNNAFAQPPCTGPGRVASSAQAVCGNLTFTDSANNCIGQGDLPNPSTPCAAVSTDNSRWYKFHCYQAGTLGFLLKPESPGDDYDWEVMDITGYIPDDVYTTELRISLNLSGQTGATGCTAAGTSDINCEGGGPGTQYNRLMNLQTGHDYLLMANNWSASNLPYTIDFSGTAELTLNIPPAITDVSMVRCDPSKLKITFSEDIKCTSITNSGSEFGNTIAGQTVTGITSDCSLPGAYGVTSLIINLQTPIPDGNYQLTVGPGSDLDIFKNVCELEMLPASIPFTINGPKPPVFDSVQYDRCTPSQIKVFYSKPIDCSTIVAGGGQFYITGPSSVSIISALPACSNRDWFILRLAAPITNFGTYTLHNQSVGGFTISDTCGLNQNSNDLIAFDVLGPASAAFNSQVKWGCVMDTIVLSHPGGNGVNSWRWNFSDGSSATGPTVTKIYPVTQPSFDAELIVSNGFCSDTLTNNIVLDNFFKAGFSNNPVDSFCVNAPVIFTDTSRGGTISNYLWEFGDLAQFNGQNPPPHTYTASKHYTIKLTVTDIHGCTDTTTVTRFVTPTPFIDFTGLNPQYCTGNKVFLRRKIGPYITGYTWDNGDGKTFTNEVDVNFSYANEGVYTITLSGVDRYCGTATASKIVPVYKVPVVKLPADTVLCQNDQMLIGVASNANYIYLWNTGATTPQILTDNFTRDYRLTADNKGCKGIDAMHVKVLTACVIKMPNAFTPNRDGLNDQLLAPNADLARDFSLKIFNRSGQLVFSTSNPLEGWDGRFKGNPQEIGTYVWMLSYTNPWTGKYVKEKGTSILLR
jgi:gliding motility-associated-like protein